MLSILANPASVIVYRAIGDEITNRGAVSLREIVP